MRYFSGCKSSISHDDDDDDDQHFDETKRDMVEERESNNERKEEPGHNSRSLNERDQGETTSVNANAFEAHKTGSIGVGEMLDQCQANMAGFETEIRKLKKQCRSELTTKCYQLRIHPTMDGDTEVVVQKFYESRTQPVLNKIKLIEMQWRTLDLWEILQSVNPRTILEFDQQKTLQRNEISSKNSSDDMNFRRSIVLCCVFEDMMRNVGWKVGDTCAIENDIFDIVGKLMMQVA